MGQVLTLLGLSVADPLRSAVAVLNIDVPALFIHFECHGIKHSYYAGWWLSTVGQLAALLVLVALLWCVARRWRADAATGAQAMSLVFAGVFLWCARVAPVCTRRTAPNKS